jgi:hypothetical protein
MLLCFSINRLEEVNTLIRILGDTVRFVRTLRKYVLRPHHEMLFVAHSTFYGPQNYHNGWRLIRVR